MENNNLSNKAKNLALVLFGIAAIIHSATPHRPIPRRWGMVPVSMG
jgi:hypothetical protein